MLAPPARAPRGKNATRAARPPQATPRRARAAPGNQAMLRLLMARLGEEAPPLAHDVLRSPGQPLDAATRHDMEQQFGQDFGHVRLHADAQAAASAEAVHARAYTVGADIVLGAGELAPATVRGRRLLAHELAHVVQQGQTPARPGLSRSGIVLARQPVDDERAKAVAEAEAVLASVDQTLADADQEDEPEKPKPSRFSPGGFTDEEADALLRQAQERVRLGSMALALAEKQARRRVFWGRNPGHNSADVREAFDLDLYWDPKEEGFFRQPYVDKTEAVVMADPEARQAYNSRLWDLNENRPAKKSRFKRAMDFVCEHTEPCSSNLEQFRRDRESGMSRDQALNRGMARLLVTAELMVLPTPGPSGPIQIGPRGVPAGGPFNVPATESALPGGGRVPAAPPPEPLLSTGGRSGGPPRGKGSEPAVPEPILDEPATNPIRKGVSEVGEPVGDYRIYGEKQLVGRTLVREIYGLKSNQKPTTKIGVGPLLRFFRELRMDARAAGANELRIVGRVVRNANILKMKGLVEKQGGTFRQIDAMTVEIVLPLPP